MSERKKLESIGDALLLTVARLYLKERFRDVPYKVHARLIPKIVNNERLTEIAAREGITGEAGERLSDAFEVRIAEKLYRDSFASVRSWLWSLFDKHIDIKEEVRRILHPDDEDKLEKQVCGALRHEIKNNGGSITNPQQAAKIIIQVLKNAGRI